MNTLNNWLTNIQKLHHKGIDLGLDRIESVASKLNLTEFKCPVITVGGTNGKGSCVKFLENILHCNHYHVGTYTSPHLTSFNERICLNNLPIPDEQLIKAFEFIEQGRGDISLTFFEFTTLAALWLFQQAKPDVILLEVGLGGRLDAVNIIDADIAVVTSVELDHMDWLGTTREQIGFEKAGIFKSGKMSICGDEEPPVSLIEYAEHVGSQLFLINRDFRFRQNEKSWSWLGGEKSYTQLPLPNLPIINATTALMAITLLRTCFNFSIENVDVGISSASLDGRYQKIEHPYSCILDVAHNPAAARMLAMKLQSENNSSHFKAVVGMLNDKDIKNTFLPLVPLIKEWHLGTLSVARGATSMELASNLKDFEAIKWYNYDTVSSAFEAATKNLNPDNKIIVFGSFYTVAEVLNFLACQS